jgi:acyl-[acyl-carrier-protein]-phospholipid O-acyltransferase/long-chain-fatty-acid--[acyl-carrier-protein] ligase
MMAHPARRTHDSTSSTNQQGNNNEPGGRLAAVDGATAHDALPTLYRDRSFWGMAATQFLGAFNDNLFKQLILLLATPTAAQAGAVADRQAEAQVVFAGSFLIFSGFAGFLSDRFSKRPIVILSKVAEIVVMLMGLVGFLLYETVGFGGMLFVLFLMGTQSAFFGPSKYGILPEMLRASDLPKANGIFLMLTFLAIIFGTAMAGVLLTVDQQVWRGSMWCVIIAILGTITSFAVRRVPPAQPGLRYHWSAWGISRDILQLLRQDSRLLWALFAMAMFWMIGGMVLPAVNALGKTQLGLEEGPTSILSASIGLGIAVGCMLGGYLSRERVSRPVVVSGAVGTVVTLALMCLPGGELGHLLGYWGSLPVLILMGLFSGMFVVPVQVILQTRPPREEKGRMIATMNQITWIGVILGAVLFGACVRVLDTTGWPRNTVFGVTALLMLPVAIFYRPKDERLDGGATDPIL